MIETNRIEFKRELTKDLDIEKEDIFGDSLGLGMASVMKTYSPTNFTFLPHFVRFSVEYINHAILSMESKTSERGDSVCVRTSDGLFAAGDVQAPD